MHGSKGAIYGGAALLPTHLKVFLGSPSDAAAERKAAVQILRSIEDSVAFKGRATLTVFTYDDPNAPTAMPATMDPQSGISKFGKKPRDCDLTILFLWSRMGTPLPATTVRDDGSRYQSGTEWEFEDAQRAGKDAFVYVRRDPAPGEVEARPDAAEQRQKLADFVRRFQGRDGSLKGFVWEYRDPPGLEPVFRKHMEGVIRRHLERAELRRAAWKPLVLAGALLVAVIVLVFANRPVATLRAADECQFAADDEESRGFLKIDYEVTNVTDETPVYLVVAAEETFSHSYPSERLRQSADKELLVDFPFPADAGIPLQIWARIEARRSADELLVSRPFKVSCAQ